MAENYNIIGFFFFYDNFFGLYVAPQSQKALYIYIYDRLICQHSLRGGRYPSKQGRRFDSYRSNTLFELNIKYTLHGKNIPDFEV